LSSIINTVYYKDKYGVLGIPCIILRFPGDFCRDIHDWYLNNNVHEVYLSNMMEWFLQKVILPVPWMAFDAFVLFVWFLIARYSWAKTLHPVIMVLALIGTVIQAVGFFVVLFYLFWGAKCLVGASISALFRGWNALAYAEKVFTVLGSVVSAL
jgi:hypothetical protein